MNLDATIIKVPYLLNRSINSYYGKNISLIPQTPLQKEMDTAVQLEQK